MPPRIFDLTARQRRRAAPSSFLRQAIADTLIERLELVRRDFSRALLVGEDDRLASWLRARGVETAMVDAGDEALPPELAGFDLAVSPGALDTVNDLPGLLIQIRRALAPDGLFLAALFGAPSLPALRRTTAVADAARGQAVQRIHPLIDARAGGDLLARAGFALPVADIETLDLSYRSLGRLIDDLRAAGATNALAGRHAVTRRWLADAAAAFATMGENGRTRETISILTLTGWAPGPDQPQPARRGSGTASLAAALKPKT